MVIKDLVSTAIKGIVLGLLFFEITPERDTTVKNITIFTTFYMIVYYAAIVIDIDPSVVTNAFFTKTIFTLVDEVIKPIKPEKSIDA